MEPNTEVSRTRTLEQHADVCVQVDRRWANIRQVMEEFKVPMIEAARRVDAFIAR